MGFANEFRVQLFAVTKKNFKLKARRPFLTTCELCCPLLMGLMSITILFILPKEDLLESVAWRSYENETVTVDSYGTNSMWDPFPLSCVISFDRTMGDEGISAFTGGEGDATSLLTGGSRNRRRRLQETVVEELPLDEGLDPNYNTTFRRWMLTDSIVPPFLKTMATSLLTNPDKKIESRAFAVGRGTEFDVGSVGYRLKKYFEGRATKRFGLYTDLINHYVDCFANTQAGNSFEKCADDPTGCLGNCGTFVPKDCNGRRLEEEDFPRGEEEPLSQIRLSDNDDESLEFVGKRRLRMEQLTEEPEEVNSTAQATTMTRMSTQIISEYDIGSWLQWTWGDTNRRFLQSGETRQERRERRQADAAKRSRDEVCGAHKTACECATAKNLGCGWARFWEKDDDKKRTSLVAFCQKSTRRISAVTSCLECGKQPGCSDQEMWLRLYDALTRFQPKIKVINDELEFGREIEAPSYENKVGYCGGVFFDEADVTNIKDRATYRIRLNNTLARFNTRTDVSLYPKTNRLDKYYYSGFMDTQQVVNDFITCAPYAQKYGCLENENFRTGVDSDTRLLSFLTPAYIQNLALDQVGRGLSSWLNSAMVVGATALAFHILKERDLKIKEGMKAMGAFDSVQYLENFVFNVLWTFLPSLSVAVLLSEAGDTAYNHTSIGTFLIIIWITYINALQLTSFLCSFFNNIFPGLLFVFLLVICADIFSLFIAVDNEPSKNHLLALIPPTNFRMTVNVITEFERSGSSNDFSTSINNFTLGASVGMNLIAILIWTFAYYYFDQVAPKEIGIQRPFYFLFTRSFWAEAFGCIGSIKQRDGIYNNDGGFALTVKENNGLHPITVEKETGDWKSTSVLRVEGLTKVFDTPEGKLTAVNNVDMTMYPGEVFALLGHNGAGKTTCQSILTGLIPSTKGDVEVFGRPLKEHLMFFRHKTGICPQQSVLWPLLTPREHMDIFTVFKGGRLADFREENDAILQQLGMKTKKDQPVEQLSGGMRRKLSLAIAFTGNPNLVFLDEPSSGMDTASRRDTWNILRTRKEGRIIVLTTHFMEEADVLGDRICIMAHGHIQCNGSPAFLKNIYKCGYNITCLMDNDNPESRVRLRQIFADAVSPTGNQATVLVDNAKEITMLVPFDCAEKLPQILYALDKRESSRVSSYSVSVSNLEEVFLKVASGFEIPTLGVDAAPGSPTALVGGGGADTSNRGIIAPTAAGGQGGQGGGEGSDALCGKGLEGLDNCGGVSSYASTRTQIHGLLIKRWIYSKRNPFTTFCKLCCPIIYTIASLLIVYLQARDESAVLLVPDNLNMEPGLSFPQARSSATNFAANKEVIDEIIGTSKQERFGGLEWKIMGDETCDKTAKLLSDCPPEPKDIRVTAIDCTGGTTNSACRSGSGASEPCVRGTPCVASDDFGICAPPGFGALTPPTSPASTGITQNQQNSLVCNGAAAAFLKLYCQSVYLPVKSVNETLLAMAYLLEGNKKDIKNSRYAASVYPTISPQDLPYYSTSNDLIQYLFLNLTSYHAPGIYLSQQANINIARKGKKGVIETWNHPMPYTITEQEEKRLGSFFFSAVNIMVGFGFVTGFALAYTVFEKENELKTQQLISGVRIFPYWASAYIDDFLFSFVTCIGLMGVLFAFGVVHLIDSRFDQVYFTTVVLLVFCFVQTPFVYLLSILFNNSNSALITSLFCNLVFAPILLFLLFLAELFLLALPEEPIPELNTVVDIIHWVARTVPVFSMGDSLLQTVFISMNYEMEPPEMKNEDWYADCIANAELKRAYLPMCSRNIWDMNGPMKNVVTSLVLTFVYPMIFMFVAWIQQNSTYRDAITPKPPPLETVQGLKDSDVTTEEVRVQLLKPEERKTIPLTVCGLRKAFVGGNYGEADKKYTPCQGDQSNEMLGLNSRSRWSGYTQRKTVHAVQNISFTAEEGEVFGLLGVNGAGKTTTFKMLVGLVWPIIEEGSYMSVLGTTDMIEARRHVGYCSQDNPLFPFMTCKEHLIMYGRMKGIEPSTLPKVVKDLLASLDLTEYTGKLAGVLSGGNKRKLVVACALIGSPKIIFMDEPSSGVDPMARRFMWSVIKNLSTGSQKCAVILTTHSMEECEALCTRAVIMVNGVFRCLGPTQHLKAIYGKGFSCDLHYGITDEEYEQTIKILENTPHGKTLAPLGNRVNVQLKNLKQWCIETNDPWRLAFILGPNSPFEAASVLASTGYEATKAELEARDQSVVRLKTAVEVWTCMSKCRLSMIFIMQFLRERVGAAKLVSSSPTPTPPSADAEVIGNSGTETQASEADTLDIAPELPDQTRDPLISSTDEEIREGCIRIPPDKVQKSPNGTHETEYIAGFNHLNLGKDEVCPTKLQEVHGTRSRIRVEIATSLAPIFEFLNKLKEDKLIEDYNVCHTSLEHIFNSFAKESSTNTEYTSRKWKKDRK